MESFYSNERINYTGRELRAHFAYNRFDISGDSLVAFSGGCDVKVDALVDLEDVKAKAGIYSEDMLHFIGEFFHTDLEKTILLQRILMAIIKDEIAALSGEQLLRKGDDIYDGASKLSVSIATSSPVSTLIHTGINIISDNTPVKTKGLNDYGIEVVSFAENILSRFESEIADIKFARCKVRGVF